MLVTLVVVIAVVANSGGGESGSGGATAAATSDEDAIRQVIADIVATDDADKESALQKYFCAGDRALDEELGGSGGPGLPSESGSDTTPEPAEIRGIDVDGDEAVARIVVDNETAEIPFTKEGGDWKVCLTGASGFPTLPR